MPAPALSVNGPVLMPATVSDEVWIFALSGICFGGDPTAELDSRSPPKLLEVMASVAAHG